MRITVDIDENMLSEVLHITGIKKKSPAINKALQSYLRKTKKRNLIEKVMSGKTDYSATNEELEERSSYDPD